MGTAFTGSRDIWVFGGLSPQGAGAGDGRLGESEVGETDSLAGHGLARTQPLWGGPFPQLLPGPGNYSLLWLFQTERR